MDAVLLARSQFAFTIAFHWLFPALTVGFSWLNVWFMTKYIRSGSEEDAKSARFWIRLFTITFAVGVATGLTMALQFGTNWAGYSATIGDVIGPALAAEVILSFFLESTFLGVILFGWNVVSKRVLWFSSLMIAIGTLISAFWIIVVDSWMQTPTGFKEIFDANGHLIKIELVDFGAAVFNPSTALRFLHTVTASFVVSAFFVFGVSAYYHLRNQNEYLVKFTFKTAITVIMVGSILLLIFGHLQASIVADQQPAKFAVYELIQKGSTSESFPALAIIDPFDGSILFTLYVPFFTLGDLMLQGTNHYYPGIANFSSDLLPPIPITVYTFHIMIALGLFFIAFGLVGAFLMYKGRIYQNKSYNKLFLVLSIFSIPLPFIATELGWTAAEVGRQPWIVYGLLKTSDAISLSLPEIKLLFSVVGFMIIYGLLFIFWIMLLVKTILKGPSPDESKTPEKVPADRPAKSVKAVESD